LDNLPTRIELLSSRVEMRFSSTTEKLLNYQLRAPNL